MKIVFLIENKTYNRKCNAEHGLSIYIESGGKKILMDAGSTDLFADNARARGVDLEEVDALVISHGHYDHTGGVPRFCEINKKAPVYIHKDAFGEFHGEYKGKVAERECGIKWSFEDLEDRLALTSGLTKITDDIVISGTVPDVDGFEPPERFYEKQGCCYVEDDLSHEQFLAIREEGGVYIFSGCSHKGIVPAIEYTKKIFPGAKIKGIIAGFHLCNAEDEIISNTADILKKEEVDFIMPIHCTGMEATLAFKQVLGEKCIIASTGDRFSF